LERYRPLGRKFQNIFTAKSKIRNRNQSRLLATVDTGDFTALDRSVSLFEAHGAALCDKFSTQKRRTEKTAKSALDDNKWPPRLQTPGIRRADTAIRMDIRKSKPLFGFDSRGLIDKRLPSSAGIVFRSAVLLISPGKSFRNSKGKVACGK
jgi:hypothetical protein